jgi:phosphate:Na+ symporter
MVHIAVAHSTFNVVNSLVFLPIVRWLEAIVIRVVPAREEELDQKPVVLERHLLDAPVIALDQARHEIVRMAEGARKAVQQAVEGLLEDERRKLHKTMQIEDLIDEFQYEITSYLASLSTRELSKASAVELPVLLHTVNDLERVGDHAVNIAEIAERKIEQKIALSDSAEAEVAQLKNEVSQMFDSISAALENNDVKAARSALVNEEKLNQMQIDFRRSHVQRMTEGVCSPQSGLICFSLAGRKSPLTVQMKQAKTTAR